MTTEPWKLKPWKLKRTAQCAACPWKTSTVPERDIPTYDAEKHRGLAGTVAPVDGVAAADWFIARLSGAEPTRIFTCHETDATDPAHCVGWLANQLGPGSNVLVRMDMATCTNAHRLRTVGPQHPNFEATLPPCAP